jgi:hypothetical protein
MLDGQNPNPPPPFQVMDANPKVDLLFMVDNSNSMSAMQSQLVQRFPDLLKVFIDLASGDNYADLHIGVITSDYGAGATGAPGCQASPGGQLGHLQAIGAVAAQDCLAPIGVPYIEYKLDGANNLPSGQDLPTTFTCMASVGAMGCGFEHQLESVYAALTDGDGFNEGFLREDARLMVILITNEDDGSAPPDAMMFDKNQAALFGYEDSFRSTRFGILCDGKAPPYADSMGPFASCVPAPFGMGLEYDISRYVGLFTLPADLGGVKANPDDLFVAAITAPPTPVQVILSNPGTAGGTPYFTCGQLNETSNPPCVPVVQHSCQNTAEPVFFGDPSVRLTSVVEQVKNHSLSSICDDDYSGAMQAFSFLLASKIGGCLPWTLDLAQPDCDVNDFVGTVDNSPTATPVARCSDGSAMPCWEVQSRDWCTGASPQGAAMVVHRGGKPAPDGTTTRIACRSLAN